MASNVIPGKSATARRPVHPGRKRLALAVALVTLGSFLPWIHTAVGNVSGAGGPGVWTFYAGMLGLAGVLVPLRRLGSVQAAAMAGVAIVLPVWQVGRMLSLVGTTGWMPGPGIVMVLGGGVLAGVAAWQLWRSEA